MHRWKWATSCALTLTLTLTLTMNANPAHALVVVWNPELAAGPVLSMAGATGASGFGVTLEWSPCGPGPIETQWLGAFDLLAGIEGDYSSNMCALDLTFDDPVVVTGSEGGVGWEVEVDALSFMFEPDAPPIGALYTTLVGSPTTLLTFSVP